MSKFIDITGNKYGRLTVIRIGDPLIKKNGKKENRWICKCDCGNPDEILVLGYNLKNGNTKSCGCLHYENAVLQGRRNAIETGKRNKKYNIYDLSNDYGIGYTTKGERFIFDKEDYDLIKDYCWYIDSNGYVVNKSSNHILLFHRLVTNTLNNEDVQIDHIFHHKNDNRKSQLRIVSPSQNHMNKTIQSNNTSGYRGVWWDDRIHKWIAEIGAYGKKYYLGSFVDLDEAVIQRKIAERKYFGEFNYVGGDDSYDKH